MRNTIDYYEQNAKSFVDSTRNVDFTEIQDVFLELSIFHSSTGIMKGKVENNGLPEI